jgi:hypothetical protein
MEADSRHKIDPPHVSAIKGHLSLFPFASAILNFETDSERIPRLLATGLASEYNNTIPYVKIPCGLCRRVLHLFAYVV